MAEKVKNTEESAKHKMLDVVFSQIDKAYGKGSVMLLGKNTAANVETISTGSLLIDQALGCGGFPRGRITEIFGPEASGKTTLALQAIVEVQRGGGLCAFIDVEHALDPIYATKLGININDLVVSQPDFGEQALDIAEMLIRSGAIDMIVVDSVAALVPRAELEGDMGDVHVGLQARLMSQALRKLTPVVHKSRTALIFINQIRHTIGGLPFANKEVTTGGNALKFYASMRIDVRRVGGIKNKDGAHRGNRLRIKTAKNKLASPFRCVEVDLLFGEGICRESDILDAALGAGILVQSGAWFSLDGEKFAQGRDQAAHLIKSDQKLARSLRERVLEELKKHDNTFGFNVVEVTREEE